MKQIIPVIISILLVSCPLSADNQTDSVFYEFPNSGVNFEGLYANPTDGTSVTGDFDEDGRPDLIIMGPNYNEFATSFVTLTRNNGDGTFSRNNLQLKGLNKGSMDYVKTGEGSFFLAVQGGSDIPAANNNAIGYVAELRHRNGRFSCIKRQDLDYGLINGSILFIDFNNDAHPDIVSFGGSRKAYTYQNDGNNSFTMVTNVTGLSGSAYGNAKTTDINRDGKTDIVSVDESNGLCVYLNSGNNHFTQIKIQSDYGFKTKPRLDIGDFNNDGHDDLVAFDTPVNVSLPLSVAIFFGNSTGNFTEAPENDFMGVQAAAVAVADFNQDGNQDILYSGSNNRKLKSDPSGAYTLKAYMLLGDGTGNFTQQVKATPQGKSCDIFTISPVGEGQYLTADFDGDGKPDVFVNGTLGIGIGGKVMRRTELYFSSLTYGWGAPVEPEVPHVWEGFPYDQVKLTAGRLKEAQDKEIRYLKSLDVDRLFAGTLEYNFGIRGIEPYGGWEENKYGSVFSHYLSAISMAYATTSDPELMERIDRCLEIIIGSQEYNGDGFYAFRDGTTYCFDYSFAKAKILVPGGWDENGNSWDTNGAGIPLYAHHKLFACLRDAYLYAGREDARVAFLKFCEWMYKWIQNFDHTNFQNLLLAEHGGFVETMADAYALSGDKRYLDAAVKFTQDNFANTVGKNINDLPGRHSNFYCPMAHGAAVHYHYSGNQVSKSIAHNFFHIVNDHHTSCNGGNGNNERFGTPDLITYAAGMRGMETCSSYNMLKLAKELFMQEGDLTYMDYFENTMYNHILATLSPREDAGVTYHTSLKPGTYKIYDNLYNAFWCCVGTGMEVHVKYIDAVYFKNEENLLINLFVPSTLDWKEKGLKATMEADFPNEEKILFRIEENTSFSGDIVIRYPSWAENGSIVAKINGSQQSVRAKPGEFIYLSKDWVKGDEIEIMIPCKLRLVDVPDDVNVSSVFYGPVLLAANIGEVGLPDVKSVHHPESADLTDPQPDIYFPELKISRKNLESGIRRTPGRLEFQTYGLDKNYTLKPFFDTHHCRYHVNWKLADDTDIQKGRNLVADHVITGDPVSENMHNMRVSGSDAGSAAFNFWGQTYFHYRNASGTGFISYDLNLLPEELPQGEQYYLQLTYFGSEPNGYGNFRIAVDDVNIAYQGSIAYLKPLSFDQIYYPISRISTDGKQKITVKFSGGRVSLYGVRLLTSDNLIEAKKEYLGATGLVSPVVPDPVKIHTEGKTLFAEFEGMAEIRLYNLSGYLIHQDSVKRNYVHTLVDHGAYILVVNDESYKVIF